MALSRQSKHTMGSLIQAVLSLASLFSVNGAGPIIVATFRLFSVLEHDLYALEAIWSDVTSASWGMAWTSILVLGVLEAIAELFES